MWSLEQTWLNKKQMEDWHAKNVWLLKDAKDRDWRAFQAHRATEGIVDRERKYLEMENMYREPQGTGQNCEDMGCAYADLSIHKMELDKGRPSYMSE